MSILEDFLTDDIAHLPNDAKNTMGSASAQGAAHHKHHVKYGHPSAKNCLPCRQKNAADFLAGNTPGVMAFYAPEEQRRAAQHPCAQPANIAANTRPDNATVEDAETVQRLVEWREEASY